MQHKNRCMPERTEVKLFAETLWKNSLSVFRNTAFTLFMNFYTNIILFLCEQSYLDNLKFFWGLSTFALHGRYNTIRNYTY